MLEAHIENLSPTAWSEVMAICPDVNLPQSTEYGAAKASDDAWKVERGTIRDGAKIIGVFQALIRLMPLNALPGGLVWISRGPVIIPSATEDADHYASALFALRQLYADKRGLYLLIAPNWPESAWTVSMSKQAEMRPAGRAGWQSAILDLRPSEEVLRKGLKQKWRNALNKAEKAGLALIHAQDSTLFDDFLADHSRFIAAMGFNATVDEAFLRRLQEELPLDKKLVTLGAQLDGVTLGWVLIARYGDTAEYLAGNSTDEGRRLNVGQLLLWQALLTAKAAGAQKFDVGGMDAELTPPGIFRFKQGIGAIPYGLAPEIEALPSGLIANILARMVRWRVRSARP
jgi:hypothetical protein